MFQKTPRLLIGLVSFICSFTATAGTLAEAPLTLQTSLPPNVLFSLSVEFPTANTAAYQGSNDYADSTTYLGLFDNRKCYTYDSTNNWFSPASMATGTDSHSCSGQWSGNFLNWATMTGLDEFRYAMTGGNRYRDTASLTVVERTYQSGQGGTSNFTNKTYQGSTATPYPATTSITMVNQGKGTKMDVTLGSAPPSATAQCSNPTLTAGTFSCDIALQTPSVSGSCTTWAGAGTSADPYKCTAFSSFSGVGTPNAITNGTKSSASTSNSETVSCNSPSGTSSSTFNCVLTDSASNSGSCDTWSGSGTSGSPFQCTDFGTFNGAAFSASGYGAAASYNVSTPATQAVDNVTSCSSWSSSAIVCDLASGRTLTCDPDTGSGNNAGASRQCSASTTWTISGTPVATRVSHTNSTTGVLHGGKYYKQPTSITYSIPVSGTYWYVPSYTGSDTNTYYYYSTYTLGFSATTSYYVRAEVCQPGASASLPREDNCEQYGTNSFKPVGELQRNGEKMRFGLFSYYKANDVDNAVMRSKLKYVAPLKWSSSGSAVSNTNTEWSSTTGAYVANPDPTEATNSYGGAVSKSGVINYINQFGTGSSGYKTYDNVGKLYYETLKYLRGLQPTTAFYEKATTTNNDGFPVITTWDDPVQYQCQKNFIIAMGDTHTWCDKRLPGGVFSSAGSCGPYNSQTADSGSLGGDTGVNVTTWTNNLGALDGNASLGSTGFANSGSYYMSGLAYWAAYNGFRTIDSTPVKAKTFVIDVQEYGDKGVNSQYWRAAKFGGVDKFDTNGNPLDWSTTISGYTGAWPKTLLPAGDPQKMIDAVRSALSQIAAQSGAGTDIGVSTGDLRSGNGVNLFSATFNSAGWYGDVSTYRLNSDLTVSSAPIWTASTFMNPTTLNPASGTAPWTTRRIITFHDGLQVNGTADTAINGRQGVDFLSTSATGTDVFSTNFSARQQAFLNTDPGSLTSDGLGADRVDYLRGDNSNEGANGHNWRIRTTSSLGDFINSSPIYVRFPSTTDIPTGDLATFKTYVTNVKSRTPMLYVGGNDGMLHAFDASDNSDDGVHAAGATSTSGKELLAFVPSAVYSRLNQLTWPSYAHKYYVDGTPVLADAQLSSTTCDVTSDTNKCWRTVITAGLGAGGQGVYALNVTDPSSFASGAAKSLLFWEFTDRDDADLGSTFGLPIVRKMNNGKWAVIFGNGYNNTASDGVVSSTGRAYLYILYLDGPGFAGSGRGNTWVLGTDYHKIELKDPNEGTGSIPTSPTDNGLSTVVATDKNDDSLVDYLYAGDRYGNLWKIDVSDADPSNWGTAFGTATAPLPLFAAKTGDTTPVRQQITTSPSVVPHPNGGVLVLFGTGSFVDQTDNQSPFSTNSFYGIWDKFDGTRITSRSQLQKQKTLASVTSGSETYAIQSNCQAQYSASPAAATAASTLCPASLAPTANGDGLIDQQLGWVLDLHNDPTVSASGERYISTTTPIIQNGLLTFVTITPSGDVCGGNTYDFVYNLDYLGGGAASFPVYYTTGTTSTAITLSTTIGGASVTVMPSGRKLAGQGLGQNGKPIDYRTDPGVGTPSTVTGCTPFVKGRACIKQPWTCLQIRPTPPCDGGRFKNKPIGRVSWRKITQ